jgi:hypothetical protein
MGASSSFPSPAVRCCANPNSRAVIAAVAQLHLEFPDSAAAPQRPVYGRIRRLTPALLQVPGRHTAALTTGLPLSSQAQLWWLVRAASRRLSFNKKWH